LTCFPMPIISHSLRFLSFIAIPYCFPIISLLFLSFSHHVIVVLIVFPFSIILSSFFVHHHHFMVSFPPLYSCHFFIICWPIMKKWQVIIFSSLLSPMLPKLVHDIP
jgi:hypothetical protein